MKTVVARKFAETARFGKENQVIGYALDFDLKPVILALDGTPDYYHHSKQGAEFPKARADHPNRFKVHHFLGERVDVMEIEPTDENYRFAQPVDAGHWLLARSRLDLELRRKLDHQDPTAGPEDSDKNASVYDSRGRRLSSFYIGDGVEEVQVTRGGRVWASYFDEGVFSNTIGYEGLNSFDLEGRHLFGFNDVAMKKGIPIIDDCHALNVVSDDAIWISYCGHSNVARIGRGGIEQTWTNVHMLCPTSFAILGDLLVFHQSMVQHLCMYKLGPGRLDHEEVTPVHEGGERVQYYRAIGRGQKLLLIAKDALYTVDLGDIRDTSD